MKQQQQRPSLEELERQLDRAVMQETTAHGDCFRRIPGAAERETEAGRRRIVLKRQIEVEKQRLRQEYSEEDRKREKQRRRSEQKYAEYCMKKHGEMIDEMRRQDTKRKALELREEYLKAAKEALAAALAGKRKELRESLQIRL